MTRRGQHGADLFRARPAAPAGQGTLDRLERTLGIEVDLTLRCLDVQGAPFDAEKRARLVEICDRALDPAAQQERHVCDLAAAARAAMAVRPVDPAMAALVEALATYNAVVLARDAARVTGDGLSRAAFDPAGTNGGEETAA